MSQTDLFKAPQRVSVKRQKAEWSFVSTRSFFLFTL
ncbi:hypothetical protein J2Z47_003731 [Cohnella thailandensis]|nr:hypothetical protein [Cohnella thailandensis]